MNIKIKKEKLIEILKTKLKEIEKHESLKDQESLKKNKEAFNKFKKFLLEASKWNFEEALKNEFKIHYVSFDKKYKNDNACSKIKSILKALELTEEEIISYKDKSDISRVLGYTPGSNIYI